MAGQDEARRDEAAGPPVRTRVILGLLLLISTLNYLDRQILTILSVPIKAELGLTNLQIGLMSGLAFAIFYTSFGLPVARLADRWNRARVLTIALALWSVMTALCGLAQNFLQLFAARVGVGVGEAGCTPPAHSMISDIVPPARRASALALFALGSPLGALIGLAAGGAIAEAVGWRMAFVIVGLPGLVVALICVFVLAEPKRVAVPTRDEDTIPALLSALVRRPAYWHLTAGVALVLFATFGQNAFLALYYRAAHHLPLPTIGVLLGLVLGIGGLIGGYFGGQAADFARGKSIGWMAIIPGIAGLLCAPSAIFAMTTSDISIATISLGVMVACGAVWYGPVLSSLQSLVQPHNRAMSVAIFIFIVNFVGLGLGPPFVGWLADVLAQQSAVAGADLTAAEANGLRSAIMIVSVAYLWGAAHFFLAARTLARDFAS